MQKHDRKHKTSPRQGFNLEGVLSDLSYHISGMGLGAMLAYVTF